MRTLLAIAALGFAAFIGLTAWFWVTDLVAICHGDAALVAQGIALRDDLTKWLPAMAAGFGASAWMAATGFEREA
jgi:uncharacterized membrane protein YqiK